MKKSEHISNSVIRRLPRYYRFLGKLQADNVTRISSMDLAEIMGSKASQIRQDLNCFGGFGQQGYGYNVEQLRSNIGEILGLNSCITSILIGAGNLGRAVASHMSFDEKGFQLIGIFDADPSLKNVEIKGIKIMSDTELEHFCITNKPQMAIICIPEANAPELVDKLISLGIDSFWNFSHYDIRRKYPDVCVENVHLSDSLMNLSYYIKNKNGENDD